MHSSENLKGFANAKGDAQDGEKVSPDALVFPSGSNTYHQEQAAREERQTKMANERLEREAQRKFFKRLGLKAAIIAGAVLTTWGTAVAIQKGQHDEAVNESNNKVQAGEEIESAWETEMRGQLGRYGANANMSYSEDGSTISFEDRVNINGETVQTQYHLQDLDNDSMIEKAMASNKFGGADYESDGEGVAPLAAINKLNEQMGVGR